MDRNILIIAGEPSGDIRAGEVLKELKKLLPGTSFWGIGGDCMEQQGVEIIEHIQHLSIIGVWEAIKNLSLIRRQYKNVTENIRKRKPHLAILIDYPGFNLKVAGFLHRENVPVIYYVIPQVWAWGRGRIKTLKRCVNKALVLFEFEKNLLDEHGIDSEFVGHPLLDKAPLEEKERIKGKEHFTIALLPGSRKSEIENMLRTMLDTAEVIQEKLQDVRFIIAENSNVPKTLYDPMLAERDNLSVSRRTDDTFAVLAECDFAIVTSGTATLETAVMQKPMVIVYRAAFLTYILVRIFKKVAFLGMPNILAGKEIVPELYQDDLTPEKLSRKILAIIEDDSRMRQIEEELKAVRDSLGGRGASRRAAEAIARFTSA